MDWLTSAFTAPGSLQALAAGAIAALALAVVGTWVVIRGMSFFGDALAHGVIPGIALAILVGFDPFLGAGIAALVMIAGVNFVHRQGAFSEDTGIGLLFVGMLAAGVLIASRGDGDAEALTEVLFGDFLGSERSNLGILVVVAVLVVAVSAVLYRPLLVLAFNERKAQTLRLRPRLAHLLLLTMITAAVVASFPTIGTLLVFGLLVGPAATAALLVRKVPAMMIVAVAIGMAAVVLGLVISHHAETDASATVAIIPIVAFFAVLTVKARSG